MRGDLKRADEVQLQATLNRDLVRPIIDLNRGPPKSGVYPRIIIEEERDPLEVGAMATAAQTLIPFGLRIKKSEVMQRLGFTEAGPDDEVAARARRRRPHRRRWTASRAIRPVRISRRRWSNPPSRSWLRARKKATRRAPCTALGKGEGLLPLQGRVAKAFLRLLQPLSRPAAAVSSAAAAGAAHADAIDDALDDALDEWHPLIDPVISPVEALVASATSLEDLRDKLAGAVGQMSVDEIAQLLAEASFTARIAGVAGKGLS